MRNYEVRIKGVQPLLMHADDIEWADRMAAWKDDPRNREISKAGDDRTPAWRWVGYTYHDGEHLCIPERNIMKCLLEAGAMVPTGAGKKTFKAQTQSGIMPSDLSWKLDVNGSPMPVKPILDLMQEDSFEEHKAAVRHMGFELYVARVPIGARGKHIRVRPRFRDWGLTFGLTVTDPMITGKVLQTIIEFAGRYKGIGDWRPGARTAGSHGMFAAQVKEV